MKIGATPPEKEKLEMGWGISLWGKMMAIPPQWQSKKILACKKDTPNIYIKRLSEKGIKKVGDFLDENDSLLTYQMFLNKYNVNINALTYYGITTCIN